MIRQFSVDQAIALVFLPLVLVLLAMLYLAVVPLQGRPFLFSSERMRDTKRSFRLFKIRSMTSCEKTSDQSALGGDQSWRVTRVGAILRASRLDELPQIFNVLRGELKFIGPRPPLRKYVERFPDLYHQVLSETPPGITGLATVMVHAREERLLKACRSAEETEGVYQRLCIPIKARLDLIYRDRRSWVLNAAILWMTLSRLVHVSAAKTQILQRSRQASASQFSKRTSNTIVVVHGQNSQISQGSKAA